MRKGGEEQWEVRRREGDEKKKGEQERNGGA